MSYNDRKRTKNQMLRETNAASHGSVLFAIVRSTFANLDKKLGQKRDISTRERKDRRNVETNAASIGSIIRDLRSRIWAKKKAYLWTSKRNTLW